ncbi:MFS transporter [Gryllotalpicola ginsengisoli]|uniref:MFS transporter n=1 Tax=Gryllotalpicola ginsengisoli TaxID=444608 RepID=UPI0003B6F846|nr:MFS transporter [Gryllotalpicola ginsengisoli]
MAEETAEASRSGLRESGRWPAFVVCIGVGALTILDLSGVNVALPSIEKGLHASSSQLQLIVAGYALAFGLALVPSGRLGDMRSRRVMFLVGLAGFVAASALCALAQNDAWLSIARFAQGAAAGTQMPQVLGLIQQLFDAETRPRAFGAFGAMVGISTALGPTLCGLLIAVGGESDGWRLLFWLNVPCGLAALVFALRLVPREQPSSGDTELDPVGLLLLGASVFCFMLPFLLTTGSGDQAARWLWLLACAALAAVFVWWERRYARNGRSPVIHFELFRRGSYRNGTLLAAAYFAAMPASFLVTTLFLQQGLDLPPLDAGLVVVPFALGSAVFAWFGGRLVQRRGRAVVQLGLGFVAAGIVGLGVGAVLPPAEAAPWTMSAAMLVGGVGGGLVISPNQTLTLAEVPPEDGSVAGSIQQLGQRIGTAVGVAAITAVFFLFTGRSGGGRPAYDHAVVAGYAVALGLLLVAAVIGYLDLRQRRRSDA